MNLEPEAPNTFLLGMKILLLFLTPMLIFYWIGSQVMPKPRQIKIIPKAPGPQIYRFKPKPLKFCENHLTGLPKGRIALVVDQTRCDICKRGKTSK